MQSAQGLTQIVNQSNNALTGYLLFGGMILLLFFVLCLAILHLCIELPKAVYKISETLENINSCQKLNQSSVSIQSIDKIKSPVASSVDYSKPDTTAEKQY